MLFFFADKNSERSKEWILQVRLCLCATSVSTLNTRFIECKVTKYVCDRRAYELIMLLLLSRDSHPCIVLHTHTTLTDTLIRTEAETTNGENIISRNIFFGFQLNLCERVGTRCRCCCSCVFFHRWCIHLLAVLILSAFFVHLNVHEHKVRF